MLRCFCICMISPNDLEREVLDFIWGYGSSIESFVEHC